MTALLLVVLCLALGVIAARFGNPPPGLAPGINWWVLNIALPALILELVPKLHFDWQFWFLILSQWLVFLGAWGLFAGLGRRFGWSRARVGGLVLLSGLGNTSFLGYPILEALRGREGLALGVVADQMGCFFALAIGGVTVAALYSGGEPKPAAIARRILTFPAFIALLLGAILSSFWAWPPAVEGVLSRLGASLSPLALFSVGVRFRLELGPGTRRLLCTSLLYKLLVAPAAVWALALASSVTPPVSTIGVLQAAMAPMISANILADQHGFEPELTNSILGAGILLSFLTVPIWHALLP